MSIYWVLMRSSHFLLIIVLFLYAASACTAELDMEADLRPVHAPILTVTGDACPIFEDELFVMKDKAVFNECDLIKNAASLSGRVVRVRSHYFFMIHGSYLSGTECSGVSNSIHEAVSIGMSKNDFEYMDRMAILPIDFVGVGRFELVEPTRRSDTIYDSTPYRFRLLCLESATEPPK